MKLSKIDLKFKDLIRALPASSRYDLTPVIQRLDDVTLGCQMKIELLGTDAEGRTFTEKKVTVLAQGKNAIEAQYNALKLALVQLQLI
jgi:hypothetical protein